MMICDQIRALLYQHPLFETAAFHKENPWEILIVGFDEAATEFFKQAMQLAVIHPKGASFRILCTPAQKKKYDELMAGCPSLPIFFSVNGAPADIRYAYGSIQVRANAQLPTLLSRVLQEKQADYIFISARNDNAVSELAKQAAKLNPNAMIAAGLREKLSQKPSGCKHFAQVFPQASSKAQKIMDNMERMARNLHWIWADPTKSYADVKEAYNEDKNHSSSLDSAASILYKLYCAFGIDMRKMSMVEAAQKFREMLQTETQHNIAAPLEYIGWAEHRRWCVEHIFKGYVKWDAFEGAAAIGKTHLTEEKRRLHLCLRESLLDMEIYGAGKRTLHDVPKEDWGTLDPKDFPDPIDQVSIGLYKARQKILSKTRDSFERDHRADYQKIEESLLHSPEGLTAFSNWRLCISRILNDSDPYALMLYDETWQQLWQRIDAESSGEAKKIHSALSQTKKAFSQQDLRYNDVAFSVNIPHILTYSDALNIAVPVSADTCDITNVSAIFEHLAAIHALEPPEGHLLIWVQNEREWEDVSRFLTRADELFSRKTRRFRTAITAHIFCPQRLRCKMEQTCTTITLSRRCTENFRDAVDASLKALKKWQKGGSCAVQYRQNCALSGALTAYADKIPHFIFDTEAMRFSAMPAEVIPDTARIFDFYRQDAVTPLLIQDISVLSGATIRETEQPGVIPNFEKVVQWYAKHTEEWKLGCSILSKCKSFNRKLKPLTDAEPTVIFQYTIYKKVRSNPAQLFNVLQKLQGYQVIRDFQYTLMEKGDYCLEMSIRDSDNDALTKICNQANFDCGNGIYHVYPHDRDSVICVDIDLLSHVIHLDSSFDFVNNTLLPKERDFVTNGSYRAFLAEMEGFGLIEVRHDAKKNLDTIHYGSRQIKSLLTVEGRLFEVFLYYHFKKKMPNLLSSVEILWDEELDLKNELDLVAITGYRTIVCEAKTKKEVSAQDVYKISSLAKRFASNPRIFLIQYSASVNEKLLQNSKVFHVEMIAENDLEQIKCAIDRHLEK